MKRNSNILGAPLIFIMLVQKSHARADTYRRIVEGILELGPRDIRGLSRLTGVPYNRAITAYNRVRGKLGLRVRAAPNTGVLGLRHVGFEATPHPEFRDVAFAALKSVSSLNYLGVNANAPQNVFGVLYAPRGGGGEDYLRLFDLLVEGGFLRGYSITGFSQSERYSVRSDCIDWKTGRYVFDWSSLTPRRPEAESFDASEKPVADKTDLLLLKELEFDATRSFSEISAALADKHGVKISDRLLLYHYTRHVVAHKMFTRYRVFLPLEDKLGVYIHARVDPNNRDEFLASVRRIPYLDRELLSDDGDYWSDHYLPPSDYANLLLYIQTRLLPLAREMRVITAHPKSFTSFTIPYELFDDEKCEWMHDPELDAESVIAKAKKLRSGEKNTLKSRPEPLRLQNTTQ